MSDPRATRAELDPRTPAGRDAAAMARIAADRRCSTVTRLALELAATAVVAVALGASVAAAVAAGWWVAAASCAALLLRPLTRPGTRWASLALAVLWGLAGWMLLDGSQALGAAVTLAGIALAGTRTAEPATAALAAAGAGAPGVVGLAVAGEWWLATLIAAATFAGAAHARATAREVVTSARRAVETDERDRLIDQLLQGLESDHVDATTGSSRLGPLLARNTLLDAIADGVVVTDQRGRLEYANRAAAMLCGVEPAPIGAEIDALVRLDDAAAGDAVSLASAIAAGTTGTLQGELRLRAPGQRLARGVEVTVTPLGNGGGSGAGRLVIIRDVTEERALGRLLAFQASHDPVTGLANRTHLEQRLVDALATTPASPVALCIVDLDNLDAVNDACGHPAGDELLREIGARIQRVVRPSDLLARVGGDQFAVLMLDCSLTDATVVAEGLRDAVRDMRFPWEERVFAVSASVGVAGAVHGPPGELLSAATAASRVASAGGGNRVHVHHPADLERLRHQDLGSWMQRVQSAVQHGRFQLLVQPIAGLSTEHEGGRFGELLVRLVDEQGRLVAPPAFLRAAQRYNLMPAVDRWVIRHAIEALSRPAPALEGLQGCTVNLSGQSLSDPDLLEFVSACLDAHPLPPGRLGFEITETEVVRHLDTARTFIAALRARGCRFGLDDFGAGQSSYGYLKSLPVDFLKIDGSFVRGAAEDPIDRAVVESINQIGHVLGMHTVAEYVETETTLALMRAIGIDYAQGDAVGPQRLVE